MAYRYRNVKTGETITTTNRVGGKNWAPVEDPVVAPPVDDTPEEAPAEETAEEAPVEKPAAKTTRKGKK